jgi:thiamine pyrophosphate-dependent acetolactate synthase large subunit-like protein
MPSDIFRAGSTARLSETGVLDRCEAVPKLVGNAQDFLIIAGLAGTAKDVAHLCEPHANYYACAGVMGGATAMGLGLALAQPTRRVLVMTGDGELLMNVGSLATVAIMHPPNLSIVCVDNGHYGETGYQKSHTSLGVDLAAIAAGAGIQAVRTVTQESDIAEAAALIRHMGGPAFVLYGCGLDEAPLSGCAPRHALSVPCTSCTIWRARRDRSLPYIRGEHTHAD